LISALAIFSWNICAELYREVTVPEGSAGKSAHLIFFIPRNIKGFQLFDITGKVMPLTVINRAGGRIEIFFNPESGTKFKLEYRDNPVKNKLAQQHSGVLQYYRRGSNVTIADVDDFREQWEKNTRNEKCGIVHRVYTGMNRAGRPFNSLNIYRGFLNIEQAGEYTFYTASTDASFILIDGREVVSWPGRHSVHRGLRGEFSGQIMLTAGIHKFEYFHANQQWQYFAIAALKFPGEKQMEIIRSEMFVPMVKTELGALMGSTASETADMSWEHCATLVIDGMQMQQFKSIPHGNLYYFRPDRYRIGAYDILVEPDFAPAAVSDEQAKAMLSEIWTKRYDTPLSSDAYRFLAVAIPFFKMEMIAEDFYKEIIASEIVIPSDALFAFFYRIKFEKMLEAEKYKEAVEELNLLRNNNINVDTVNLELGRMNFYYLAERELARKLFKEINPKKLSGVFLRNYYILEADLALFFDGFDRALSLYSKMDSASKTMSRRYLLEADGALISLRNALISKRYADAMDYLDNSLDIRPELRLNPEINWLKAQLLAGMNRPRYAACCAELSLLMNPDIATAAKAALWLGDFYRKNNDNTRAMKCYEYILTFAPQTKEAVNAEHFLKELRSQKEK